MPYGRRYKKKHHSAARSLQRAWRARKRRKTGLLSRTAQSNRRAIKQIKKNFETKMVEEHTAVLGNRFRGQSLQDTQLNINGWSGTGYVVVNPLGGIPEGTGANERVGDWIKLKSLTYRVKITATTGLVPDTHNVCGCIVVLDREPDAQPPNVRTSSETLYTPDKGTLLSGQAVEPDMMFQNLDTCGKSLRYKVLKHHKLMVQPVANTSVVKPERTITATIKSPYKIRYDPTSGFIQNQRLLFFFYSSSTTAPHPTFNFKSRVRYTDQG